MTNDLENIIIDLENLPTGDYKYDDVLLNNIALRTLILIEDEFAREDRSDDLHFVVSTLISKMQFLNNLSGV